MSTERTIDATKTSPSTSVARDARVMALSANGTFQPVTLDTLISLVRDNIQIGGRNLLTGTQDEWMSVTANPSGYFSSPISLESIGLKAGDPVSLSLRAKPSVAGKRFRVRLEFYNGAEDRKSITGNDIFTDEMQRLSISTVVPAGYHSIRWAIDANLTATTITGNTTEYIRAVKLERGNIPTDWSPAPEDLLANRGGGKIHIPNVLHFLPAICGERSAA